MLNVNQLVDAEVIRQAGTSGRSRLFEATDVFNVLTDFESGRRAIVGRHTLGEPATHH